MSYTKQELSCIIDYANRSFRQIADGDYIAARFCHRLGLEQQFLWSALQAVEKYIKGILLFNFRSTKNYGHDAKRAYDALFQIPDINFKLSKEIGQFVQYLTNQGANRYFTHPYHTRIDDLLMLDTTVWCLRRYCQFIRHKPVIINGKKEDIFQFNLDMIHHSKYVHHPNTFVIFGGYLERIIERPDSQLRKALTWRNLYYGRYRKKSLKRFTLRSSSGTPTHFLHPDCFSVLEEFVKFEPNVQGCFQKKK